MKRLVATLFVGAVGGVALAVFVGRTRPRGPVVAEPSANLPSLVQGGDGVAKWLDRSLLQMAERDFLDESQMDAGFGSDDAATMERSSLTEQRDELFRLLSYELGLSEDQLAAIRAIVEASPYFGQGNPAVSVHPMTRQECRAIRAGSATVRDDQRICGAPNMVALFDTERGEPRSAKLCIDQFEFPNVPCEYPVVWVRASEAAQICRILDKRLCDAHEWEGACAGKLLPAAKDYESFVARLNAELFHNRNRTYVWATGGRPDARTCGTGAKKTLGCVDASWDQCGTNSYPVGAFPRCVSPFGVYDLHGNVAEHMNLPLQPDQLGAMGGVGETEMKGSWFAFDEYRPHPDDCRWRAPAWHATPLLSETSHFNYHLGFRCCRDLE